MTEEYLPKAKKIYKVLRQLCVEQLGGIQCAVIVTEVRRNWRKGGCLLVKGETKWYRGRTRGRRNKLLCLLLCGP